MSARTMPGPGDAETWPPYAGHPHDPRGDDCPDCGVGRLVEDGCDTCGWTPPELDVEAIAEARGW